MLIKMNKKQLLGIFLLFCVSLTFLFYIISDKTALNKLAAPININIEIDKTYVDSISLVTKPNNQLKTLTPTNFIENSLKNTIIHTEIINEYILGLSLQVLDEEANNIISSIDNISVFIGNKLSYFSSIDIGTWEYTSSNGERNYTIPVDVYKKSFIKSWINWYGDLNFIIVNIVTLITQPYNFLLVYLFSFIFIFLFSSEINVFLKKYNKQSEIIILLLLLIFGFLLRLNSFTIHSAWVDELNAACFSANPSLPFINVMSDPGNPPLFYIILRIWFSIFGWSETLGRLLSVFLGAGGILSLYYLAKTACGKKYAFIAAFLLTISYASISFSNEIRAYILLILLGPLVSRQFFLLLHNITIKNMLLYAIFSILLVNTHYYGILFVAANFVFYLIHIRKKMTFDKIIKILILNLIIAASLLPYFIITAFKGALSAHGFNSWIPRPDRTMYLYAGLLILLCFVFMLLRKKNRLFDTTKIFVVDYSVFLILFIYFSALVISFFRPIFVWRYFSICLPYLIVIMPFFILSALNIKYTVNIKGRHIKLPAIILSLTLIFFLSNFVNNWKLLSSGGTSVFKETQQFIALDAKKHSSPAQLKTWWWHDVYSEFYGMVPLSFYSIGLNQDVLYLTPVAVSEYFANEELVNNNIYINDVLKLRLAHDGFLYKISNFENTNAIFELSIIKDLDLLRQSVYDILSMEILNENIILSSGSRDPWLLLPLASALSKPSGETLIEIRYSNSDDGYLQVFYDYGYGLTEEDSTGLYRLGATSDIEKLILPIVGWKENNKLVAIRIDPPDDTIFTIQSIRFLFIERSGQMQIPDEDFVLIEVIETMNFLQRYFYTTVAELQISRNIEQIERNIYDIFSVEFIDGDIVLFCGYIDPWLYLSLEYPLPKPRFNPFIEIVYTNSRAGYLQVYYDYGFGLSEELSTGKKYIQTDYDETTIRLPILGWDEGMNLIGVRIDPPDDTVFTIKSIKVLSGEEID